jgi:hypothetical protein
MSMILCESCDRLIDSDDDPDCFVEVGNMRRMTSTMVLCEPCRERMEDEIHYQQTMGDF